ncbi:MAG TPA: hypothetical protein VFU68_01640 [Terracidiphilus sp.]|nr:hypothetical protein [Terracidiphilus sp.]
MSSSQPRPALTGTILGFPLKGFSLFQSLLLSLASACFTFFASTATAIFALLLWNQLGGHSVNYADSYLYVGLPLGILVLILAVPFFGALWIRARMHA